MSNQETTQGNFFNDHYEGIAFINRPRIVTPKHGSSPFVAVDLAVRIGSKDAKEIVTRKVDCIVRGTRAKHILEQLMEEYDFDYQNTGTDKSKAPSVQAWFRCGDLESDLYIDGQGEPKSKLRARLLSLEFVRVSGVDGYYDDDPKYGKRRNPSTGTDAPETSTEKDVEKSEPTQAAEPAVWDEGAFAELILDLKQVKLDKDDKFFLEKKTYLKANGYGWNSKEVSWDLIEG